MILVICHHVLFSHLTPNNIHSQPSLSPGPIRITGNIPSGVPGPTVSWFFPMSNFGSKFMLAIIVLLIDLLESISIARSMVRLPPFCHS